MTENGILLSTLSPRGVTAREKIGHGARSHAATGTAGYMISVEGDETEAGRRNKEQFE
jgi:hypothetical protein